MTRVVTCFVVTRVFTRSVVTRVFTRYLVTRVFTGSVVTEEWILTAAHCVQEEGVVMDEKVN